MQVAEVAFDALVCINLHFDQVPLSQNPQHCSCRTNVSTPEALSEHIQKKDQ